MGNCKGKQQVPPLAQKDATEPAPAAQEAPVPKPDPPREPEHPQRPAAAPVDPRCAARQWGNAYPCWRGAMRRCAALRGAARG